MKESPCSDVHTCGVRVQMRPQFAQDRSHPSLGDYLFSYEVIITNESQETVQLLSRKWRIINAHGDCQEIEGPGVVGETPILAPGEQFTYSSYCPLDTYWGTMEGVFIMKTLSEQIFEVEIGRCYMVAPESALATV